MAQEGDKDTELTPEQQAALLENGRVANVDEAIKNAAKAKDDDQTARDQAAIDAEKAAEEAAAKAAADKKAEEEGKTEDEEDDEKWKEEFVQTGNPHADNAIALLKEKGVTPVEANDIFKDAIESGDLAKVKWDILESRLGKATAALVRTGVEQYYEGEYKQQRELVSYAHEQVGGEEGWKTIQKWSQSKAKNDPAWAAEVEGFRKALAIGGFAGKAAVDAIKKHYESDPKNGSLGHKMERGKVNPAQSKDVEPLSRRDYFAALEKAGGDRAPEHVRKALWAQRQAGQKAGM